MQLKIAQVVGLNTDQKAAQVISSIQDQENAFFAVLILACDDAFTKGRSALSELSDYYFDSEASPAEKLTSTFKEAENKFSNEDYDLCLGGISGKILYLIGKGQVEVHLKRLDKLSPLLSVGAQTQLISGFLNGEDRLLFSTKSLITFLGEDLEKSLNLPIETFEEEISNKIGVSDLEDQGLAGLLIEIKEEEVEIPSLPPEDIEQKIEQESIPAQNLTSSGKSKLSLQTILNKIFAFSLKTKSYLPKSGRGRLILAVILIVIIVLGIGFKYQLSRQQQKQTQFNQILQSAKDDYNGAKGLATLNPIEAKNKLVAAKGKVNQALSLKPQDSEAQNLKKQLDEESPSILKQSTISDFPLFLDMDLVKKNFRSTKMSLSAGKLLLLDEGVKTLVTVDLAKKSNQILAGLEQLGSAALASLNGNLAFIYSKDKGVLRVDATNQKLTTISKKDDQWGLISDMSGFASNVYLLDTTNNKIWKYIPTQDAYSNSREYLNSNTGGGSATKVDLSNSLRMQIESSVYVLKSGGEIIRFTRGDKDHFSLGGLDKGIKDPKSFFVSSDTDNLYILDSGNSRLLIVTKTGEYKGQMSGDKFSSATDLVVDEKSKKVYLLDGSKIYTVDLK